MPAAKIATRQGKVVVEKGMAAEHKLTQAAFTVMVYPEPDRPGAFPSGTVELRVREETQWARSGKVSEHSISIMLTLAEFQEWASAVASLLVGRED